MKICGISDIHGDLTINIPECDVLCICGDVINLNDQRDIPASKKWWETRFANWVKKLYVKKVIIVPGNHDFYLERMMTQDLWSWWKDRIRLLSDGKVEMLIDETYEYEGITFYGSPWINPISFQLGRWAFERDWQKNPIDIPKCDVLITHDNPYENEALGNLTFGKATYHLYGHWHDGAEEPLKYRFNCSMLNDMYNRKHKFKCVIIDVMTKREFIADLMGYLIQDPLFACPKSNIIEHHNKDIFDLLYKYANGETEEDWPPLEDQVPWDTSTDVEQDVLESSVITDFMD